MYKKIGLFSLTALVFSSMVGAGIFSLPQNMAMESAPLALMTGWAITGVGVLFLGLCFLQLSRLRPDLQGGIYVYAREGFGELIGFIAAWGYWLCTTIGTVSYLVIMFSAIGVFTDSSDHILLGQGNTLFAIACESIVLWSVHYLVSRGVHEAAGINLVATIAKTLPILLFILAAIYYFQPSHFTSELTSTEFERPFWQQVRAIMLITLWVFTGIEGAAILSKRAKNMRDVGNATLIGVLSALAIYVAVTLLSFGLMSRQQLAQLSDPAMAGIMAAMLGHWGQALIVICLIISVSASYLTWTLFSTEVPHTAACGNSFPVMFKKLNRQGTPINSLWLTNLTIQICLILVYFAQDSYKGLAEIAASMILLPYLLVCLFLVKISFSMTTKWLVKAIGLLGSCYGIWLLYAVGWQAIFTSIKLYLPGLLLFFYTKWEYKKLNPTGK